MQPRRDRARLGASLLAVAFGLAAVWPALRIGEPPSASAQGSLFQNPDSARADSLRKAYNDSVALADSLSAAEAAATVFGGDEGGISQAPSLLAGTAPEHPFTYNTTYGTLRARRTWDQDFNAYFRQHRLAFANRTDITVIEDPDVKRNTRNKATTFELGYSPMPGFTWGARGGISRNSDLIGIRTANSIIRNTNQAVLFTRWDKKVEGLPLTGGVTYGLLSNDQPEYSQSGGQLHGDASSSGTIHGGIRWNAAADYNSSRLNSIAPTDSGGSFQSSDHSTDNSVRGGVSWSPRPWFSFDSHGSIKRGQVQRPENETDPVTLANIVVQERVKNDNGNADVSVFYRMPYGVALTLKGNLTNQQILYTQDSTRTNITKTQGFTLGAADTLFGAPISLTFQNGTSNNDYTRRPDGYVQDGWTRAANLTANRRVNARTSADFATGITLDSRRFTDFRPSTTTSFPPSNQDVLRATGRLRLDYAPLTKFTTGLQGQLDYTENINLDPATSASNTDQTGYAVTWRWGFTPVSFWNVSQDNSAGAQVATYPFSPSQDNINYIYQLNTTSLLTLTPKVSFETHYNLRYLSRGSYKQDETGARRFGKSGGSDSYDMLLRAVYQISSVISFDISQQTYVTNNFSEPSDVKTLDSQTKRHALYINLSANPKVGTKNVLNFTIRRTMTRDESITYGFFSTSNSRPDDYWQLSGTLHTFFDL